MFYTLLPLITMIGIPIICYLIGMFLRICWAAFLYGWEIWEN